MINSIWHTSAWAISSVRGGGAAGSGADGCCRHSWARSTTPSKSISRLTSCSELNLHENQIHKFSHGFDQEFCGSYCSFWIVVKVMADGNVSWNVCRCPFPFFSHGSSVLENLEHLPRIPPSWNWHGPETLISSMNKVKQQPETRLTPRPGDLSSKSGWSPGKRARKPAQHCESSPTAP